MDSTVGHIKFEWKKTQPDPNPDTQDTFDADRRTTDYVAFTLYDSELDHIQPILNKFSLFLKACGFADYFVGVEPKHIKGDPVHHQTWSDY